MSERDWQVVLLRDARRYLEKLPEAEHLRLLDALTELERDPFAAPIKPLRGRPERSLRVGGYRILIRIEREAHRVIVTRIGPRGDVYKR